MANGTSSGCVAHHVTILSNFVKSSAMEAISIKSSSTIAGSLIVGMASQRLYRLGYHPGRFQRPACARTSSLGEGAIKDEQFVDVSAKWKVLVVRHLLVRLETDGALNNRNGPGHRHKYVC